MQSIKDKKPEEIKRPPGDPITVPPHIWIDPKKKIKA
jgi:hypothetical protein